MGFFYMLMVVLSFVIFMYYTNLYTYVFNCCNDDYERARRRRRRYRKSKRWRSRRYRHRKKHGRRRHRHHHRDLSGDDFSIDSLDDTETDDLDDQEEEYRKEKRRHKRRKHEKEEPPLEEQNNSKPVPDQQKQQQQQQQKQSQPEVIVAQVSHQNQPPQPTIQGNESEYAYIVYKPGENYIAMSRTLNEELIPPDTTVIYKVDETTNAVDKHRIRSRGMSRILLSEKSPPRAMKNTNNKKPHSPSNNSLRSDYFVVNSNFLLKQQHQDDEPPGAIPKDPVFVYATRTPEMGLRTRPKSLPAETATTNPTPKLSPPAKPSNRLRLDSNSDDGDDYVHRRRARRHHHHRHDRHRSRKSRSSPSRRHRSSSRRSKNYKSRSRHSRSRRHSYSI